MTQEIAGTDTLGNGAYQIPSPKDDGNAIADVLESFMERMAVHDHQGNNSKKISLNFTKEIQDLSIGIDLTWQAVAGKSFRALITMPLVANPDNQRRFYFKDGAYYTEFYPTVEYVDATSFYISSNDSSIDVRVVYF